MILNHLTWHDSKFCWIFYTVRRHREEKLMIYSAHCRRPWGTSQTDPRWRLRISKAEEQEREAWRTAGGIAEKQAKQNSIKEGGAWGAGLILPQLWVGQEVGEGGQCVPSRLSPPPPQLSHRNDQRLTPPCWKEGRGRSGRWGGVRKSPGPQQLASW